MEPVETPEEVDVCVGDDVGELAAVDDGMEFMVEDGELVLRQLASLERATSSVSDDPPERPTASIIVKIIVVPAATSVTHVKLVPVEGGCRRNTSPPGMSP